MNFFLLQVSDWGLVQLGELNPGLEKLNLSAFQSDITQNGIEVLQKTLPRVCERKFVVEIVGGEGSDSNVNSPQASGSSAASGAEESDSDDSVSDGSDTEEEED